MPFLSFYVKNITDDTDFGIQSFLHDLEFNLYLEDKI